jgi:hypothetical protein
VGKLMDVQLTTQSDVFVWKLTTSSSFTVKSMYLDYMNEHTIYSCKQTYGKLRYHLKLIRMLRGSYTPRYLSQRTT